MRKYLAHEGDKLESLGEGQLIFLLRFELVGGTHAHDQSFGLACRRYAARFASPCNVISFGKGLGRQGRRRGARR